MADILFQFLPPRDPLPVNDDATPEYGEMKPIFYPGYSECQAVRVTNTTGAPIVVDLAFKAHETDDKWWETMRIYPSCSGILPSGIFDTSYQATIGANDYEDVVIYSQCTKEGFSNKYPGSYWTNTGFAIANMDLINDTNEQNPAVDCDAAGIGSILAIDLGVEKDFVRIRFATSGAAVNATFDIQYSDDNVTWYTAYEGADLSTAGTTKQVTFWWDNVGSHQYWRIYKTDAAAAGGDITDIQWLRFDAHQGYDYGVYGDKKCYIYDRNGNMDDFEIRSTVMVNVDVFARQSYDKPIGRIGNKTDLVKRNFDKWGHVIQLYYIPTVTMSYTLNAYPDFQLERRVWDVKAFVTPQKRELTYTAAADGLAPSLYRYDQRTIYLDPYGPDKVGWYQTNYDFWHQYGHSYYVLFDNHCYKLDNIQPMYVNDELVAFSARMFLQSDMVNLGTDPRNYVLTNREGLFIQFPNGGYSLADPENWVDPNTPEQRPLVWSGAYPFYICARMGENLRPNPYSHTGVQADDLTWNGEIYETEVWDNPETTQFTTTWPVMFGTIVDGGNHIFYQMPRFYNWIGYADVTGNGDPFPTIVQLYLDEDCTIPVKMILTTAGWIAKVEWEFEGAYVAGTGEVTLERLGGLIETDGHFVRTPSKLYVRYIATDAYREAIYYPQ